MLGKGAQGRDAVGDLLPVDGHPPGTSRDRHMHPPQARRNSRSRDGGGAFLFRHIRRRGRCGRGARIWDAPGHSGTNYAGAL